jgi:succinoglycan biosynthesis protein ExoM
MNKIFVSISIATYKRSELLKKLMESLILQKTNNEISFEVVVVDNDPQGSAEEVVRNYKNSRVLDVKYFIQPVKNISLTRNVGVENAVGEYLLFIDDDEIASPDWIQSMVDTICKYNADAVFGRVLSYFEEGTPDWIKNNPLFNRQAPPTGTEASFTRSGNCIVKASLLKNIPGPFDPQYGTTGGEDTHLFERLRKQGAKFINCYEGYTSEYVPPQRATFNYLLKRSFVKGNNYTRRELVLSGEKKSYHLIKSIIFSILFGLTSVVLTLLTFPNKYWRLYWATKIASNWGHLSAAFGYYGKAYK